MLWAAVLLTLGISSANAGEALNEQPMYGYGVPKSEEMLRADDVFVADIVEKTGSREAGAREVVDTGWQYLVRGDLQTSMRRFNQAYLLDPELGEAYSGMAVVVMERDQDARAAEALFNRALASRAVTVVVHKNYGLFLARQGRMVEAEKQLSDGLALDADAYVLRFLLSAVLYELGRQDESAEEMHRSCGDASRFGGYEGRPEEGLIREACTSHGVPLN